MGRTSLSSKRELVMDASYKKWWKEDMDLIEVYDPYELPREFGIEHIRSYYMHQIGLPTELVIKDAQVVTPIQARYWQIERWLVEGKVVDYEYIRALEGFSGSAHYTSLYIVELWGGNGDDGHIEPCFEGYGLTADIKKAIKHLRKEY